MRQEIPFPRIRDLREDKDWTQSDVADMLHITQTCYSKYEIGTSDIPTHIWIALSEIYEVSVDYLMGLSKTSVRQS